MKRKSKNKKTPVLKETRIKAGRKTRSIHVDYLARIEGEGALFIKTEKGKLTDLQLRIFEPPRFFEALLRGRAYADAPDITSRICGICPVAYMMSSVHAIEQGFGVVISPEIRMLRRLLYCGEWIESHTLHIIMLHAPDFLGYPDAVSMAKDYPEAVQRGLRLKKAGNHIMRLLGGREVHPINVKVGGFYAIPPFARLGELHGELTWATNAAEETIRWVAGFKFPPFEREYEFVSLRHPGEYPMNEGRIVSSRGLDIDVSDYEDHFEETQVPHSTALHSRLRARGEYLVGPLARYNLNFDRLPQSVQDLALRSALPHPCHNPFQMIIVRAIEVYFACTEALRIIESLTNNSIANGISGIQPSANVRARDTDGFAATEAPRGLLYHHYKLAGDGTIQKAQIVPPTSQNQPTIESDLRQAVAQWMPLSKPELTSRCEQVIRNYDPCISCSTHFLKVEIQNA